MKKPLIKSVIASGFLAVFLLLSPAQAQNACRTPVEVAALLKEKSGAKIEKIIDTPRMIDFVAKNIYEAFDSRSVGAIYVYSAPGTIKYAMAFYDRNNCLLGAIELFEYHLQSFFGMNWRDGTF